jgi:uncharacterized protein YbjT (DUF2867 family)
LTDAELVNDEYVLTGPETLGYADAAAIIESLTGRPVRHRSIGVGELASRLRTVYPSEYAAMLAGLDARIRAGSEDYLTPIVERVTGNPARDFRSFVLKELT